MKYLLQINTGTLDNNYYNVKEIIEKIEFISSKINITKVIFGWYSDIEYNKELCDYLKNKNIKAIFKLPILSEITDLDKEQDFIYYKRFENNSNLNFYKNDKFSFVCPSSINNIDYIMGIFDNIDSEVNFDGVFFDRIRYPSIALNNNAILGCGCESCKKKIRNIKIEEINEIRINKRNGFIYEYNNKYLNKLMKIKRDVITKDVKILCKHYKKKGKIIGIDTFAPNLCDLVGQDLLKFSKYVDFIKPMNYLCTLAPAGIPYELNGLSESLRIDLSKCWEEDLLSIDSSIEMSKELLTLKRKNKGLEICIGIDANNIDGICNTNIDYLKEHINKLEENGIEEVVLSWDCMLIDNNIFDKLK